MERKIAFVDAEMHPSALFLHWQSHARHATFGTIYRELCIGGMDEN